MEQYRTLSRTVAGVVAAGLSLAVAGPAAAAQPDNPGRHVEFERFVDDVDEVWVDGRDCELGFDVHYTREATGTFRFTPRGRDGIPYAHTTVHGTETWSANGHTFTHHYAVVDRDFTIVDEGETLLITGQAAGGDRTYVDGKLTFRNPGMNRYQFRIDHNGTPADPFDDPEDSFVDLGVVKGSTGLNETEGRTLCGDLAQFLAP